MSGAMWHLRNETEVAAFNNEVSMLRLAGKNPRVKFIVDKDPKTTKQIRYAHSLCNALATFKQASPEQAKKDAKVAFGVVVVCTSLITGDRSARLTSFADYTKAQMEAFITALEVHLCEQDIPYIPAKEFA